MVWVGGKRPLRFEDLPLIPERSRAVNMARILDPFQAELKTYLKDPEGKKAPSYLKDVWRFLAVPYCFAVFLDVCGVALQTTQPAVMAAILSYLQTGDPQFFIKSPMGLAVFYFFMSFLSLIFRQATMQMFRRMWFGLRSALLSAVYAKSLKLTNKSSNEFTKGRILQMVNSDVPSYCGP
ncbi:hypothetical protein BC830DRAFT_116050 [Chytriomyces sp. MP71]|nr:hypothetical protein BC830DRAFT_116050 [Chytriomyces sp. MP71]